MENYDLKAAFDLVNNYLITKDIRTEYTPTITKYDCNKFYEQVKDIVLDELAENIAIKINNINEKNSPNVFASGTLMIDGSFYIQRVIIDLFNKSQASGAFDGTIFEYGTFEVCSKSQELKNPSPLLFMTEDTSRPFYNVLHIKFTPNLVKLINASNFIANTPIQSEASRFILSQKKEISNYLNQMYTLSSDDRKILQQYFIETAVPVLTKSLNNFIDAVENHNKTFDVSLHTTTPFIYGENRKDILIYLLYLYTDLLQNNALSESILPFSTPEINCRGKKEKYGILCSPFEEKRGEKPQHNLRLVYNQHIINKKND